MKYLLIVFFLFANYVALAQSRCFKAYHDGKEVTVFCVGQTIRFKDCSGRVDPEQEYYYHPDEDINNPNKDTVKTITFTKAGPVTIRQLANFNNQGTSLFTQDFEVKEAPEPSFAVNSCDKRSVRVSVTDKTYDTYELDFGNGHKQAVTSGETVTYSYQTEGPYKLTLTGSFQGGTCSNSTTTIENTDRPLPKPELNQVNTDVDAYTDIHYLVNSPHTYLLEHINPADNSVISVDTLSSQNSGEFIGVRRFLKFNPNLTNCFRVRVTDACGNSRISNTVCSINLTASVKEGEAVLTWKTRLYPGQEVELRRGNTSFFSSTSQEGVHTDTNLDCGKYCYGAYVIHPGEPGTGISATKCVEIDSGLTPPSGVLQSSYNLRNQVELNLQVPPGESFRQLAVQRSTGGNWQPLASSSFTTYLDDLSAPASYCYRATYTDECNAMSSLSNSTCPMLLTVREQNEMGNVLSWSPYSGFQGGVARYEVEVLDPDFQVIASYPATGTSFTDNNAYDVPRLRYRIKATSRNNNHHSYSNHLELVQPIKLFVPSAFSPNDDGLNDVFTVKGKSLEDFSIRIYNRSGQVVYQSTNAAEGWDGTYKGQLQPAGAYVYEIEVTAANGEKKNRKGTITLIR